MPDEFQYNIHGKKGKDLVHAPGYAGVPACHKKSGVAFRILPFP
jgi:hypothetical protein